MGTMGAVAVGAVAGTMAGNALAGGLSSDKETKAKDAEKAEKEAQELQHKADEAKRKAETARAAAK
jgi:Na+/glutamate symporter